jgi:hypothetical protein
VNRSQPVLDVVPTYIAAGEGYILFDHAIYTPTELSRDVIEFAVGAGFVLDEETVEKWEYIEDEPEWLRGVEWEAIDYLNAHHTPNGGWWCHDGYAGAFGCWPITEDDA